MHLVTLLTRAAPEDLVHALRVVAMADVYLDPGATAVVLGRLARSRPPVDRSTVDLSERETEVQQLVAQGYSNREIGEHLKISIKTVETYKAGRWKGSV